MDRQLHEVGELVQRAGGEGAGELILRQGQPLQRGADVADLRGDLPGDRPAVQMELLQIRKQTNLGGQRAGEGIMRQRHVLQRGDAKDGLRNRPLKLVLRYAQLLERELADLVNVLGRGKAGVGDPQVLQLGRLGDAAEAELDGVGHEVELRQLREAVDRGGRCSGEAVVLQVDRHDAAAAVALDAVPVASVALSVGPAGPVVPGISPGGGVELQQDGGLVSGDAVGPGGAVGLAEVGGSRGRVGAAAGGAGPVLGRGPS